MSMSTGEIRWANVFPYREGEVVVTRLAKGWQLSTDDRDVQARTLIEAFEQLGGSDLTRAELDLVLAVLSHDGALTPRAKSEGRTSEPSAVG